MDELWQLYDEQGQALVGQGAIKADVFKKGILHGASHVWIWRQNQDKIEILLQKRAENKLTWPSPYDKSAAGHINLGETPLETAIREAKEEINLEIVSQKLVFFGVHRAYLIANNAIVENELQWLYHLEITDEKDFILQSSEVDSLEWVSLNRFKAECIGDKYLPHARLYYDTVISAIEANKILVF